MKCDCFEPPHLYEVVNRAKERLPIRYTVFTRSPKPIGDDAANNRSTKGRHLCGLTSKIREIQRG